MSAHPHRNQTITRPGAWKYGEILSVNGDERPIAVTRAAGGTKFYQAAIVKPCATASRQQSHADNKACVVIRSGEPNGAGTGH